MKAFLVSFAVLSLPLVGQAVSPGDQVAEITTVGGRSFRQCTVVRVYPDGVSFTHAKGAAKVQFTDLPAEWRDKLGYDSKKAAAYQKEIAERRKKQAADLAKARQDMARARLVAQEAELKRLQLLERAYLARLAAQVQAANDGGGGLLPAIGFPGIYYGPLNAITGPVYGGAQWYGREPRYSIASLGCGSGGIVAYQSSRHQFVNLYQQPVHHSPTLGNYRPGPFVNLGGFLTLPYGGGVAGGAGLPPGGAVHGHGGAAHGGHAGSIPSAPISH